MREVMAKAMRKGDALLKNVSTDREARDSRHELGVYLATLDLSYGEQASIFAWYDRALARSERR